MTPPTNGDWAAALLDRLPLTFPLLVPPQQLRGKAFTLGVGSKPGIVVLEDELVAVVNPADYVIDEGVGAWSRLLGDTSANPELSWEYWNGKGWWKLPVTRDDTRHFKSSGALRFDVPRDIASSDWAGKTNFWIRARLIGGDYGREKITARTKDLGGGVTEQTVERSPSGIRAPSVVTLSISYRVCTAVQPTFVLAQDSGSIKDQSSRKPHGRCDRRGIRSPRRDARPPGGRTTRRVNERRLSARMWLQWASRFGGRWRAGKH